MSWFLIALAAPALWSVSNHIDKFLLQKYIKSGGIGALVIFSSLIYVFIIPFFFILRPDALAINPTHALLLIGGGILDIIGILIYLYALSKDEASVVVPIFQTMPVFIYGLGYFILGERLTTIQIIGSLLVLAGAIIVSIDTEKKWRIKHSILWLMLFASFILSINNVIFKKFAIDGDFWVTNFWSYAGDIAMGVFFLVFIKKYRDQFLDLLRTSRAAILGINFLNEGINVGASLLLRFATLLAPIALVQTVNGFQPLFVFLLGIFLTLFFPKLGRENIGPRHITQKLVAIFVMFIGSYIINRY